MQPFISYKHSPIQQLATFLDCLLRPLVTCVCRSTTIVNGADFIRRLDASIKLKGGRLWPSTLFAAFKIQNFYSVLSHGNILDTLGRFLTKHITGNRLEKLSIITIQTLTELFLNHTMFYYNHKLYRYRKGCPMGVLFTKTLGNIFLLEWQSHLLNHPYMKNEFYGRFASSSTQMAFFTYNGTSDVLQEILSNLNQHHPDMRFDSAMGQTIQFLNIQIENQHGHLYTSVYHDPTRQSYVLPFVSGHTRLIYSHYFRSLLIRAGQYCSNVDDFDRERLYIELTYLANGFPLQVIEHYLNLFYLHFQIPSLRTVLDQTIYDRFRDQLFRRIDKEPNQHQLFHLHYLYEWGPRRRFNEQFRQLWTRYIHPYPMLANGSAEIRLTTKHLHSLNTLLTRDK